MSLEGTATPLHAGWASGELESQETCPLCGGGRRAPLHTELEDRLYGVAGRWTLWSCASCTAAWLDPRPTRESIGRAYVRYQTHERSARPAGLVRHGPFRALKERRARGFLNTSLGHRLAPAWPGVVARRLLTLRGQRRLDDLVRHLPPPSSPGVPLLDVGCGNGSFLGIAALLGYEPEGVEPDPRAVEVARGGGWRVHHGGLPHSDLQAARFEQLTACHVIEHVHDPLAFLVHCRTLLRSGGRLWVQTPNLSGHGHAFWGRDWRGLEPPRHLTLFTPEALRVACLKAGFDDVRFLPPPLDAGEMFRHSLAVRLGVRGHKPALDREARRAARRALRDARGDPTVGESLVLVARAP